jgi:hypothetical protein
LESDYYVDALDKTVVAMREFARIIVRCSLYELYPRNLARANSPVVSVTKLGRITLNAAAARILVQFGVSNTFLMWDMEARKFALKLTEVPNSTSYQVRFARDNSSAGFSAKSFLKVIGYDFEETRALPTLWIEGEAMLEVTLPQEGFNRVRFPRQRRSRNKGSKGNGTTAGGNTRLSATTNVLKHESPTSEVGLSISR